ncbi:MAG: radical SAM protein [Elusimicrobia bacterium]|nr:radical SAM protein [Elusimicrobiota bacterium]
MGKKDCYEIILNHNCDLNCRFCSQGDFDPALRTTAAQAVRRIYAARKAGYRRLGFSGGEALLRRDLPALVAAARKTGFRAVRLQTNGMKLEDPALAKRLADAGLNVCKFTFLGRAPGPHDALTGRPGSFKRSLRGLDNMLALRLSVGVNLLITKRNYRGLPATLRFFMRRGVTNFVLIYPIYTGNMRGHLADGVPIPKAAPYVVRALDLASASGLDGDIKALNLPPCVLGRHAAKAVDLYKFNTVVYSPRGLAWDLDENISGSRVKGPPCAACRLKRRCLGLDRNYAELFGWSGIRPAGKIKPAGRGKPLPGYLNAMEACFMEILRQESPVSTRRALQLARRIPLCQDCRDGAGVLTTGQALIKKGLVSREFSGGSYLWRKN